MKANEQTIEAHLDDVTQRVFAVVNARGGDPAPLAAFAAVERIAAELPNCDRYRLFAAVVADLAAATGDGPMRPDSAAELALRMARRRSREASSD